MNSSDTVRITPVALTADLSKYDVQEKLYYLSACHLLEYNFDNYTTNEEIAIWIERALDSYKLDDLMSYLNYSRDIAAAKFKLRLN